MLKVDPKLRPSAAMIIQVIERLKLDPNLIKKLSDDEKDLFAMNDANNMTLGNEGLLGTIAVPLDFEKIDSSLPQPNYTGNKVPKTSISGSEALNDFKNNQNK